MAVAVARVLACVSGVECSCVVTVRRLPQDLFCASLGRDGWVAPSGVRVHYVVGVACGLVWTVDADVTYWTSALERGDQRWSRAVDPAVWHLLTALDLDVQHS